MPRVLPVRSASQILKSAQVNCLCRLSWSWSAASPNVTLNQALLRFLLHESKCLISWRPSLRLCWSSCDIWLQHFFFLFSVPGRTERAAVHRLASAYLISSRARSGTFRFHGRREIERMWKCAFLLWNGPAQNSTISGFLSISSCHQVL